MARKRRRGFGSPPEAHRVRGVLDARRAVKLARAAERLGCGTAPGILIKAAMYVGRVESEARGQQSGAVVERRNRNAYKLAERAEKAIQRALRSVKARCLKG